MTTPDPRHILATSGGFERPEPGEWRALGLVELALELSGAARPAICYVGTAAGDAERGTAGFLSAFRDRGDVEASVLSLFTMPNVPDVRAHLLAQDVIWVGGGSVANLLAVWRVHDLDEIMRDAWHAGVVLAGVSAGSICWHVGGTTDSFGTDLRAVTNGLALLPYGNGVHYDTEEQRRPLLHELVAAGTLPASYATDDGAGLHYAGTELVEAVSERRTGGAYVVEGGDGRARETALDVRRLGPA